MNDIKKKIGFVYFNSLAHIYHSAAIACEMSKNKNFEITMLVSSEINLKRLKKLMGTYYPKHRCRFQFLYPSKWYHLKTILTMSKKGLFPKISKVVKNNLKLLMAFDVLVVADFSLRHLMEKDAQKKIKYICTFHGAGDGSYGFSKKWKQFDFFLVSGKTSWNRLLAKDLVNTTNAKIVGYPKFDLAFHPKIEIKKLFDNDNLTFLYNPHFKKKINSWNDWGNKILDFFHKNKQYNLIFAPHVMLFNKVKNPIGKKYYNAMNILIDYNSEALMDMTYTINSDIYIGDVSSQIYEFLYKPRPCVFLNPHSFSWKNDPSFRMWNLGDVVNEFVDFKAIINNAVKNHGQYIKQQVDFMESMFSQSDVPASKRAAKAMVDFLEQSMGGDP